jgi:hypothetical protein
LTGLAGHFCARAGAPHARASAAHMAETMKAEAARRNILMRSSTQGFVVAVIVTRRGATL